MSTSQDDKENRFKSPKYTQDFVNKDFYSVKNASHTNNKKFSNSKLKWKQKTREHHKNNNQKNFSK